MVLNFIPGMSVIGAVGQLIVLITQSNKPLGTELITSQFFFLFVNSLSGTVRSF